MTTIGIIICPHLRGSREGTICCITNNFIKNMEDISTKLCLSRRHEACPAYKRSLQNMIAYGEYSAHCK